MRHASNAPILFQMLGQMRSGDASQPPEERFASQLDQLASMGFGDRQANIQGTNFTGNLMMLVAQSSFFPIFARSLEIGRYLMFSGKRKKAFLKIVTVKLLNVGHVT